MTDWISQILEEVFNFYRTSCKGHDRNKRYLLDKICIILLLMISGVEYVLSPNKCLLIFKLSSILVKTISKIRANPLCWCKYLQVIWPSKISRKKHMLRIYSKIWDFSPKSFGLLGDNTVTEWLIRGIIIGALGVCDGCYLYGTWATFWL